MFVLWQSGIENSSQRKIARQVKSTGQATDVEA
jgi:hypothetical protein